jgi:site-specific DNA-cytosine methylase
MEVVDLFCGLGGFAAGALQVEGCSVVLGVDQVCRSRCHAPYGRI